jgi:ATP phosphoribosyltransferase regulatory subunit
MPNVQTILKTQQHKNMMIDAIMNRLFLLGFTRVEPYLIEQFFHFSSLNPSIDERKLIKFVLSDGTLYTLRPDITTSVLHQFIPFMQEDDQCKVCYASTSYRQGPSTFNEIAQLGFEMYGTFSVAEKFLPLFEIIAQLKKKVTLVVNYPSIMLEWVDKLDVPASEKDRLLLTIRTKAIDQVSSFALQQNDEVFLKSILTTLWTPTTMPVALQSYFNADEFAFFSQYNMVFDFSGLAQYDYYSGVYLEGFMEGYSRPVLSGGVYDKRTEIYQKSIQAFGISLDLTMLLNEVKL